MKDNVCFRLKPETIQEIEIQSKLLGIKKTTFMRKIIENYLSNMNLTKGVK